MRFKWCYEYGLSQLHKQTCFQLFMGHTSVNMIYVRMYTCVCMSTCIHLCVHTCVCVDAVCLCAYMSAHCVHLCVCTVHKFPCMRMRCLCTACVTTYRLSLCSFPPYNTPTQCNSPAIPKQSTTCAQTVPHDITWISSYYWLLTQIHPHALGSTSGKLLQKFQCLPIIVSPL